jgi:8-amino-7-oxononanoate synthase
VLTPPQLASLDDILTAELQLLRGLDRERRLRRVWNRRGAVVETERGPAVDFSSNDYLGLASDSRLVVAAERALHEHGVGAGAARLISGNNPEHEALESELADFFDAERAITFSTGYAANVGTISALVGRGDAIFSDALNHASVIDGCRLSRADVHVYSHADASSLADLLERHRAGARRALIVTDGLFSMDGDVAPLREIVDLARRYDAWTYVDDAHAIGVLGADGRGTPSALGCHGEIDVCVGTLGKAFGVAGAFVYGSATLAHYLLNTARSFIFSTAVLPAQAAAAREGVRIVRAEPERRERVLSNALTLVSACAKALERGRHHERSEGSAFPALSPIIPIRLGDEATTMRVGAELAGRGYLVGAIRPPTVPVGGSRLRIAASAAHTPHQIAALADALAASLGHEYR